MEKKQKYEWKKVEKEIYPTGKKPIISQLPAQTFITIEGEGNPNEPAFGEKVSALYSLAYAIKMAPKKGIHFPDAFDYAVYPLEGFWSLKDPIEDSPLDKSKLVYKIMLKQPNFVTPEVFAEALKLSEKKVSTLLLNQLQLETVEEGLVGQILHKGSFESEPESFGKLAEYLKENGYQRISKDHKEIYLNDFNRTAVENLKTILRVRIEKVK